MGRATEQPHAPVVERTHVPVIYSTCIVRVERFGDHLLLCFGFDTVDEQGRPIREIVAKVMRPISDMMGAQRLMGMAHRSALGDMLN